MTDRMLQNIPLSYLLLTAESAARQAGDLLRESFYQYKQIKKKSSTHDIVTQFDVEAEKIILQTIKSEFPKHAIVAEESGQTSKAYKDITWIIDPIDGTWNFARQIPSFSISIAVEYQGDVYVGLIYNPLSREWYTAIKGEGAKLNNAPIKVSTVKTGPEAALSASLPILPILTPHVGVLRRSGSAALDMAYVAKGSLEAMADHKLAPWDIAAGALIIEEAGGVVTTLENTPLPLTKVTNILVGNREIHALIREHYDGH